MNSLGGGVALCVTLFLAACAVDPVASAYAEGEGQDGRLLIALAWVGIYDGSGEVTVGGDRQEVHDHPLAHDESYDLLRLPRTTRVAKVVGTCNVDTRGAARGDRARSA